MLRMTRLASNLKPLGKLAPAAASTTLRPRLFNAFAKNLAPAKLTPVHHEPSEDFVEALESLEKKYGDPATKAKKYQVENKFNPDHWKTVTIRQLLTDKSHGIGELWLQSLVDEHKSLVGLEALTAECLESFLKKALPAGKSLFYACASALSTGHINSGVEHYHHRTQVPAHPKHGFRESVAVMSLRLAELPDWILDRQVAVSVAEKNGHAGKGMSTQLFVAPFLLPIIDGFAHTIITHGKDEHRVAKKKAGYWDVVKQASTISDKVIVIGPSGTDAVESKPTKGMGR